MLEVEHPEVGKLGAAQDIEVDIGKQLVAEPGCCHQNSVVEQAVG